MKKNSFSELAVFCSIVVDSQRFLTQHELTSTSGHACPCFSVDHIKILHLAIPTFDQGYPHSIEVGSKTSNSAKMETFVSFSCFMHVFFQDFRSGYFGSVDDERVLT